LVARPDIAGVGWGVDVSWHGPSLDWVEAQSEHGEAGEIDGGG
jgi:hypothetical protein